jgi:pimeloyl-ACP methyl ester carboxylesterase
MKVFKLMKLEFFNLNSKILIASFLLIVMVVFFAGCRSQINFYTPKLEEKIASKCKVIRVDKWHGYNRVVFDFKGYEAWVVEPHSSPRSDRVWTWTMQWADAFVERTGVLELLNKGWYHVTIDTFRHRMNDEGLRVSREYQRFLVDELGFNPKANLVGLSWGGFFSTRYASHYPDCVSKIYLDAPLLVLDKLRGLSEAESLDKKELIIGPWAHMQPSSGIWKDDERMPINLAEKIAKSSIPILLFYGTEDQTVPPELNSEVFIERFEAAGGKLDKKRRYLYGHHPHGVDEKNLSIITKFFEGK